MYSVWKITNSIVYLQVIFNYIIFLKQYLLIKVKVQTNTLDLLVIFKSCGFNNTVYNFCYPAHSYTSRARTPSRKRRCSRAWIIQLRAWAVLVSCGRFAICALRERGDNHHPHSLCVARFIYKRGLLQQFLARVLTVHFTELPVFSLCASALLSNFAFLLFYLHILCYWAARDSALRLLCLLLCFCSSLSSLLRLLRLCHASAFLSSRETSTFDAVDIEHAAANQLFTNCGKSISRVVVASGCFHRLTSTQLLYYILVLSAQSLSFFETFDFLRKQLMSILVFCYSTVTLQA